MAKLTDLETINSGEVRPQDGLYLIHKDEPTEEVPNPEYEDRRININKLAAALPYDATESGLTATTLQTAIDEVVGMAPDALGDIGDVAITSPQTNQLLKYNETTSKWENSAYIEGTDNTVSGINAHGEGRGVIASGSQAHAEGYYTQATYQNSHAEGSNTIANANDSHTEGFYTQASAIGAHAEGAGTYEEGSSTNKRTLASGFASHAEGQGTTASGGQSHAEGYHTQATTFNSHAEGQGTIASQDQAHAEGFYTLASGYNAHAEGYNTIAGRDANDPEEVTGNNTHAEGFYTKASGYASHAEGSGMYDDSEEETVFSYSEASGFASHVEGYYTQAEGQASHAEGYQTITNGDYSHAEGSNSYTTGLSAHAEGVSSQGRGRASHAEGQACIADGNYSHAGGIQGKAVGKSSFVHGANFFDYTFSFQFALDLSSISDRYSDGKYYFDNACDFNGKTITIKLLNPDKRFSSLFYKFNLSAGFSINDQTTDQSVYGFGYTFTGPFVFSAANNYSISLIPTLPSTTTTIPANTYITEDQCILSRESGYTGLTNMLSEANGSESIVLGTGLNAIGNSQTVIGILNSTDDTKAFILGNGKVNYAGETVGTDITFTRSNALTVDWDGNLEAAGIIKALNIPDPPISDGTYTLQCTVSSGVATYAWV